MFCLQLLSHCEGHRTNQTQHTDMYQLCCLAGHYLPLVKSLVGSNSHFDFIAHSQEEESTFRLTEGHLSDDLVEALTEELFSDGANAALTGLSFHDFLVEHLSEMNNIESGGWLVAHILDVVLSVLDPLSGWQDLVQDLVGSWLVIDWRQCSSFLRT